MKIIISQSILLGTNVILWVDQLALDEDSSSYKSAEASQITSNSIVCSPPFTVNNKENFKISYYWPFVRGFPGDFSQLAKPLSSMMVQTSSFLAETQKRQFQLPDSNILDRQISQSPHDPIIPSVAGRVGHIGSSSPCCKPGITVTSDGRHDIPNHQKMTVCSTACIKIVQTTKLFRLTTKYQVPHYWSFVRGIHRSPVDSPHKWPVMPFHIMACISGIGW